MARIGLKSFLFSTLDDDENVTGPKSLGKAIDCKVSTETNSAELYGDDALIESDYTFNKGTVSITIDDDNDSVLSPLLGHSISEEYVATTDKTPASGKVYYTKSGTEYTKFTGSTFTASTTYYEKNTTNGEVIRKDTDVAPYVAFGRIITKIVNGVYKYKVEFLCKVKFKDSMPDEKTKGESVEFTAPTIEGTILKKKNGEWSRTKTFDTYAEAHEYLTSLLSKSSN